MDSIRSAVLGERQARWLVLLAALSFLPTVAFYYVGEEAIFPIISLEMWQHGEWMRQRLFGLNPQHNPLFNWLIIPVAAVAGWEHVLEVTRVITIAATLATAAMAGWLAWRLRRDRAFAWFAALVYLTLADVLMYRGWLAYVDPLFGMFIFSAIAVLWVACEENRPGLLVLSAVGLTCAFLSKAFTAYVFYGSAVFVLLFFAHYRKVLLGPVSLGWHGAALLAPMLWLGTLPANTGQGGRMFFEMLAKLIPAGVLEYMHKLVAYPAETFLRIAPAAPLAAWFAWRGRIDLHGDARRHAVTALILALACYLPYWLAPASAIRYLMPIYPLAAIALALVLWSADKAAFAVTLRWLVGILVLKVVAAALLFPYYQKHYRGENYLRAAEEIMRISRGFPLYTENDTASGLCVAGYIDSKWRTTDPIVWVPRDWQNGFVIAESADPANGKVKATFKLGGDELYLLCRGAACDAAH